MGVASQAILAWPDKAHLLSRMQRRRWCWGELDPAAVVAVCVSGISSNAPLRRLLAGGMLIFRFGWRDGPPEERRVGGRGFSSKSTFLPTKEMLLTYSRAASLHRKASRTKSRTWQRFGTRSLAHSCHMCEDFTLSEVRPEGSFCCRSGHQTLRTFGIWAVL